MESLFFKKGPPDFTEENYALAPLENHVQACIPSTFAGKLIETF